MPIKDIPITTNLVLKWSTFVFTVLSGIIALVLSYSRLSGQIQTFHDQEVSDKMFTDSRLDSASKDIDILKRHMEQSDKDISDINRKLDVAVAILDRIEKKVDSDKGK